MVILSPHTKFHMLNSNGALVLTVKPKAKRTPSRKSHVVVLQFTKRLMQKKLHIFRRHYHKISGASTRRYIVISHKFERRP
jgi:hypothetical protein